MKQFFKKCLNDIVLTIKFNSKMKRILFLFVLVNCIIAAHSQSFEDASLEQFVRKALVEGINIYGDDVNLAGVVIMEVTSGNVIANVCIGQFRGKVKEIPNGNNEAVPSGISRPVLYLSMMGTLRPDFVVETGTGIYNDSITGCVIEDLSHKRGGFGTLTLKRALDLSDVGIYKAVEAAFNRNMGEYGHAVKRTGIFFENHDDGSDACEETDSWSFWSPCDIIYRSPFSLYQQTAWVNMVANKGKLLMRFNENDSTTPICEVKNKAGLDSLASAMFETVEYGTGIKMKSKYIRVAGIVNVSPPDVINCRGCFAAAFFPYERPRYTIGVFVNKHDRPAGRIIASKIAGNIIEYMIKQYLHLRHIDEAFLIEKNSHKFHPAEKGR